MGVDGLLSGYKQKGEMKGKVIDNPRQKALEQFAEFLKAEIVRWAEVIKKANILGGIPARSLAYTPQTTLPLAQRRPLLWLHAYGGKKIRIENHTRI